MILEQVTDQAEALALRVSYFTFVVPTNISVHVHRIRIDGQEVGYVATEDFNTVGAPHLFVHPAYRNNVYMRKIDWIFKNVYCPLMKALGKEFLVTNCDQADSSTINFLTKAGFAVKKTVVAELVL